MIKNLSLALLNKYCTAAGDHETPEGDESFRPPTSRDPQIPYGAGLENAIKFNIFKWVDEAHNSRRHLAWLSLIKSHTNEYRTDVHLKNFDLFLTRIFYGYTQYAVSYHNDLHALDVMQMSAALLAEGMKSVLKMNDLECLALLLGAACHDYGHDGFNNGYHTKIKSSRWQAHGAQGTQEKFHFAESWKIAEQTKLLSCLSNEDLNKFRNVFMGVIIGTDMGEHMKHLKEMQTILEVDTQDPENGFHALVAREQDVVS